MDMLKIVNNILRMIANKGEDETFRCEVIYNMSSDNPTFNFQIIRRNDAGNLMDCQIHSINDKLQYSNIVYIRDSRQFIELEKHDLNFDQYSILLNLAIILKTE